MKVQSRIVLRGIVEGVGMRPALYRFSAAHGLKGYAVNHADHVDLVWQGEPELLRQALRDLPQDLPVKCSVSITPDTVSQDFPDFSFHQEPRSEYAVNLAAPPDRVPCKKCLDEIHDPADRRYRYAFNACGVCGPRTTVIEAMPYDRGNTSWTEFPLCPDCRREYENPADRRFHIQGISCPECGPKLQLFGADGQQIVSTDPVSDAAKAVDAGKILALKGVGGFQLICKMSSASLLRERKNRPDKPFALMADSLETVRAAFELTAQEEALLTSPAGPAVLLKWQSAPAYPIAPDSPDSAAVMLPSSPLHHLLFDGMAEKIVIATSGNLSGLPPVLDTKTALKELLPTADLILSHNRKIVRRNDDSVCAVTAGFPQIWRRGRGFGGIFTRPFKRRIAAAGAGMKNTFAISDHDRCFISSHFGELDDVRAYRAWCKAFRDTLSGFRSEPEEIVCDLHPDYPASRFAAQIADELGVPLRKAPHHCAHALAAMADTALDQALVFVFDGTGLDADGVLRGAELFDMDLKGVCRHIAKWDAVPLPGGDNAVLHPYLQLAARRISAGAAPDTDHVSSEQLAILETQCESHWNAPETASAGRLFDAVSALCGLAPERISYDSQAAVRLETAARNETGTGKKFEPEYRTENGILTVDWSGLFRKEGLPVTPRGFHESVADAMVRMAQFAKPSKSVILTGGVFQNRLLTQMARERLESLGLNVFLPKEIPVGDGGISCGQLLWGEYQMEMNGAYEFAPGGLF